ncbi:LacI family DNA-binding transcriptional regulator [Dactylosporangium sp. NPDC000521]|uniref:LacI family DNA-binding transcriptional regulator n=1 Tax=Dactylosporangium sp. NPDC000521 TaxID=3363975 RepID=UPI0036971D13
MRDRPSRTPSLIEVATEAGVSTATAGRVLGGYGQVSAAAAERVHAAATRLGYRPNALARSLIHGSTQTIGVVVTDVGNPFFAQAVRGISDKVRAAGYEVVLFNTDSGLPAERNAIRVLSEKRADGIIIATGSPTETDHLDSLRDSRIPVVLLDRPVPGRPDVDSVTIANADSARTAVRHLLTLGHRRIAVITEAARELPRIADRLVDSATMRPSAARLAGYLLALQAARIKVDPALVVYAPYERDRATEAILALLAADPTVTAVFATDNVLAAGTYQAIQASGRRFPQDISMVGFDDQDWTTIVRPTLTVVRQPSYELGARAGGLLLRRMTTAAGGQHDGTPDQDSAPEHVRLRARLIKRESTMPVPSAVDAADRVLDLR